MSTREMGTWNCFGRPSRTWVGTALSCVSQDFDVLAALLERHDIFALVDNIKPIPLRTARARAK